MEGPPLAGRIRAEVAEEVGDLGGLKLVTVQVGNDPGSTIYLRRKHEAAQEAGIESDDRKLPEETSEKDLLALLAELDADEDVDGILVQLPLPEQIDEARVIRAIEPVKDVDGFHPFNAGQLYLGRPTLVPATPLGIMAMLAEHRIPLEGAEAVGLWFMKRWAEYLTFVATTALLPLEIWELTRRISPFKIVALVVNLAIVIYLLLAKRLFGLRGGAEAERAERERDTGWEALERTAPPLTTPAS